jgi:hypothetical protein
MLENIYQRLGLQLWLEESLSEKLDDKESNNFKWQFFEPEERVNSWDYVRYSGQEIDRSGQLKLSNDIIESDLGSFKISFSIDDEKMEWRHAYTDQLIRRFRRINQDEWHISVKKT